MRAFWSSPSPPQTYNDNNNNKNSNPPLSWDTLVSALSFLELNVLASVTNTLSAIRLRGPEVTKGGAESTNGLLVNSGNNDFGVLVDLAGPKIRLGEVAGGSVECVEGSDIFFVRGTASDRLHHFVTTYPTLVDELAVGDSIMLADGTISLVVSEKASDHARCRVVQGGVVRSRQGVNLPGVELSMESSR